MGCIGSRFVIVGLIFTSAFKDESCYYCIRSELDRLTWVSGACHHLNVKVVGQLWGTGWALHGEQVWPT